MPKEIMYCEPYAESPMVFILVYDGRNCYPNYPSYLDYNSMVTDIGKDNEFIKTEDFNKADFIF